MTRLIEIGSKEHQERLAWRDSNKYRDSQRYDNPYALTALQENRIEAEQRDNAATEAGGYVNPFDGVDDVADTDPCVVGWNRIATVLLAAEHLIEAHVATGIDLSIFGGVSDLVDWALDYSGICFDADVEPEGAYI